ncbi:alanyl-tRNA editing protein [Candidatus Uabimicrobium amorphum]|uniref:Alanine--tRNA ligase n=1 Tax=Uabimicrobium amorphum TaxID=2596890 RepID=A0A5S9ITC9_UABAM|nr:alanyl-tRNA editing protein [Candidatus Uabimicrobium amorphum]BBM87387.1 alanyl-tRNA editing protein [Candidatus Uabimicrobium amorphum]
MTKLLYQTDSYLKEFTATITEVTDEGVVLSESGFYPGGGGQPCDYGSIENSQGQVYAVTGIKKYDGKMIHVIEGDKPGIGEVKSAIDWERRYKLMRTHTAMHILCAVIWRDYGAAVTGGNMEPLRGRMDFELEGMQREMVNEIEKKINEEVQMARSIVIKIHPREEALKIPDLVRTKTNLIPEGITEIRTVEIEGLDLQADGGTHVANTKEVGSLKLIKYKSKGRINKRLTMAVED